VYGIPCEILFQAPADIGEQRVANQVFRMIQEAVNNAAKHSGASKISIQVSRDKSHLQFRVEDNGKGMSLKAAHSSPSGMGGVGIQIMELRARTIGAQLTFSNNQGSGTIVFITIGHA